MRQYKYIFEKTIFIVGLLLLAVFIPKVMAQNVPQGYQSDLSIQKGMIVRLKAGDGSKVEPLKQAAQSNMLGVVVAATDAPVSLSRNTDLQQVYVANNGQYDVLVSDQNGAIKVADYISVSSLTGVGMKATAKDTVVLGKAVSAFDGKTNVDSTATLSGSLGDKKSVTLGRVRVDINVARNPLFVPDAPSGVPQFLSKAAQVVTDRPVGAVRIYASLGVLAVVIVIAGIILYAGVRSGITAIGRNPLAKHSIVRNLITVVLIAMIIFVVGLLAVYLILRI